MKLLRRIILVYLIIGGGQYLQGQDFIADVQYFGVEDGLSHRDVSRILQDSRGFIWVGTRLGLNRFDGNTFQIFTKEKQGLINNEVSNLLEDNEGWLWVFPRTSMIADQISFVNIHTNEVKSLQERFGDNCPFAKKAIDVAVMGPDKKIYLSQKNKLYQIDQGKIKELPIKGVQRIAVKSITPDYKLLALNFLDGDKIELIELDSLGKRIWSHTMPYSGAYLEVTNFFEDALSNKWLFLKDNSFIIPAGKNTPQPYTIPIIHKNPAGSAELQDHFFLQNRTPPYWYKDDKQVFLFSLDGEIIFDFGKSYPEILKNNISRIYFDNQNHAWFSTQFGLYKVQLIHSSFTNYLNQNLKDYHVHSAFSTRGIAVLNKHLLINSTLQQRYIIDLEKNTTKELHTTGWGSNRIFRPICLDSKGGYYMGGNYHLVHFKNEEIQKIFSWKKGLASEMSWSIHQDNKQNIWLGLLDKGLGVLQNDSISFFNHYNDYETLSFSSIYDFLQWDDDHILISSTSGIYVLHTQKGIIQRFSTKGDAHHYIPYDLIHHLHKDKYSSNTIWVATGGGGLLKLNLDISTKTIAQDELNFKINRYEQFSISEGLSHNTLYAIYEDTHDNLWMSSDYGIIRLNKSTHITQTYTVTDGLPFNEFNRIAHFQASDGRIFFGSMNGVTSFYPADLLDIQVNYDVPFVISRFQQYDGTNDELVDHTADLLQHNKIVLQPQDQFFVLDFALLEYKDAGLIKYSYRIDGQGESWIYLEENRLRISGLPYGTHQLQIRAQGASGQFAKNQLSIPIHVLRPFYFKSWFITLISFFGAAITLLIFRSRIQILRKRQIELENKVVERTEQINADKKIIEKQAEELRSLDNLKSHFFANISHELRTPLTLMLAPITDIINRNKLSQHDHYNLLLAQRNGKQLQKMINEILDLTKLEAGKMRLNKDHIDWYSFLKTLTANFESIARQKEIKFTINYDCDLSLRVEMDAAKMEMILANILSNAFKYTHRGGKITLSTLSSKAEITIEIRDNGSGIHEEDLPHIFDRFFQSKNQNRLAEGGTGIGLAITKEFVQLMEGDIQVTSSIGAGTSFIISIPLKKAPSSIDITQPPLLAPFHQYTITDSSLEINGLSGKNEHLSTILLVEDNPDLQLYIKNLLAPDYNLIAAFNGQEALDLLASHTPEHPACHLILSDIMMPVMDGYQLLNIVKSKYSQIPVIMLTAKGSLDDKLKALRIGVDDYLTKPFSQIELKVRIENLIKNATARQLAREEETNTQTDNALQTMPALLPENKALQNWLKDLEEKTIENFSDFNYTTERLASDLNISKRQLLRRMKISVGLTPGQYLKNVRLLKARELLLNGKISSVKATALSVGYKDVSYFSREFNKEFGKSPSEFLNA